MCSLTTFGMHAIHGMQPYGPPTAFDFDFLVEILGDLALPPRSMFCYWSWRLSMESQARVRNKAIKINILHTKAGSKGNSP